MLQVGPACRKRNLKIRYRRPGKHAPMGFFHQMGENEPLPVLIKHILAAVCIHYKAAPGLSRLQDQMHLRIMPERFKMPHPLDRPPDCFLIHNISGIKGNLCPEPFLDKAL